MDLKHRITCDPAVMEGQPCIRGLRIPVAMIFDSLAALVYNSGVCRSRLALISRTAPDCPSVSGDARSFSRADSK
ncbi:MAG: DUF433 domain-containing protein [Planctomycetes bacterium]|nr:DUF433 domain-containing protein [Planctomycetota bacterium]